jgi:hypothetical protein
MIYSVFNWNTGRYRYFDGPGEGLGIRPQGKVLNDEHGHHQLESLLPIVPRGSRPAGDGDEPRGRIAVTGMDAGEGTAPSEGGSLISGFGAEPTASTSPWLSFLAWAAVIYLASELAENVGHTVEKRMKK